MTIAEYNQCVDNYADGVYRFILKNIQDEDMARDIIQEVFTRMWEKVKDISYSKSRSYLFTAAYHTMIDMIRREKSRQMYQNERSFDRDSDRNSYSDLKEILDEALARLPEIQKAVILLRDYEGYSYKEIGEITNLNESQVKVYIYRARMYLKNYLVSMDRVI
jgi:RNA polymerase sigma-70 factor (ECF subfamily)